MDRDERDITGLVYAMMVIELGLRATRHMIAQNVDHEPCGWR
jgi:hypothetical protein